MNAYEFPRLATSGAACPLRSPGRARCPRRIARLLTSLVLGALCGCNSLSGRGLPARSQDGGFFGWHFYAPFDTSEVKTVFVYFKSQSFRRDLQQQLTEAVTKEINMRTPYRVVGNPQEADSLLSGIITMDSKNLVVEAPTNLARELNATMNVQVTWTHNPPLDDEKLRGPTLVAETINFVPEVGETTLSAYNHVIQSISKQIVDMMEQPWFNQNDVE
jgi:Lipopolysaccharide-assembly